MSERKWRGFIPLGGGVYLVGVMERSALTGLYRRVETGAPAPVPGGRDTDTEGDAHE